MLKLDEFRFEHIECDTEELDVSKRLGERVLVDDCPFGNVHGDCVSFHCRDGSLIN